MDQNTIVNYIKQNSSYFMDRDGMPYIQTSIMGQDELYPVHGGKFEKLVRFIQYAENKGIPSEKIIKDVQNAMIIETQIKGECKDIGLRVGKTDNELEIDLANGTGGCVAVNSDRWYLRPAKMPYFRPKSLRPLAVPQKGGDWILFKKHFNTKSDEDLILLISFMIFCLQPDHSYPVLCFVGEQGSGKTTATEMVKRLVDPTDGSKKGLIKNEKDLFVSAKNCHLQSYDNISHIKGDVSDHLCRLVTGTSFTSRALYTNGEEFLITVRKPIILNGITDFINRPDLIDRSVIIELASLAEGRRPESKIWEEFERDLPLMMGVLMDGLRSAMKNRPTVSIPYAEIPRMADFAFWCTAAEDGIKWEKGAFLKAYQSNQTQSVIALLSNDPVAIALRSFLYRYGEGEWEGTATELLEEIAIYKPSMDYSSLWPSDATRLSSIIQRMIPNLRAVGIEIIKARSSSQRTMVISKTHAFSRLNKDLLNKNPPASSSNFLRMPRIDDDARKYLPVQNYDTHDASDAGFVLDDDLPF